MLTEGKCRALKVGKGPSLLHITYRTLVKGVQGHREYWLVEIRNKILWAYLGSLSRLFSEREEKIKRKGGRYYSISPKPLISDATWHASRTRILLAPFFPKQKQKSKTQERSSPCAHKKAGKFKLVSKENLNTTPKKGCKYFACTLSCYEA